jgi:transcriptional regulator with XRE-family HTH domain
MPNLFRYSNAKQKVYYRGGAFMSFDIGGKLKELRTQNNLTQEELADRSELSKGFISQIERNLTSPSIATLMDILECLGSNLKEFFSNVEDERIVFRKEDFFVKEDKERTIKWIVPNAQKNDMEPIIITIAPDGRSAVIDPHSGEEFGFILSGSVNVVLGKNKYKAKKGESFYYEAGTVHYLENTGKTPAVVIWVCTPPNF